jgi:hypothetical protein
VRRGLEGISDEDWKFIYSAVEAGWTSPRIADDCPDLGFAQVVRATRVAREDLRIDGRHRA